MPSAADKNRAMKRKGAILDPDGSECGRPDCAKPHHGRVTSADIDTWIDSALQHLAEESEFCRHCGASIPPRKGELRCIYCEGREDA
jgi:hypothetical protein